MYNMVAVGSPGTRRDRIMRYNKNIMFIISSRKNWFRPGPYIIILLPPNVSFNRKSHSIYTTVSRVATTDIVRSYRLLSAVFHSITHLTAAPPTNHSKIDSPIRSIYVNFIISEFKSYYLYYYKNK